MVKIDSQLYNQIWEFVASKVGDNTDADFLTDSLVDIIQEKVIDVMNEKIIKIMNQNERYDD